MSPPWVLGTLSIYFGESRGTSFADTNKGGRFASKLRSPTAVAEGFACTTHGCCRRSQAEWSNPLREPPAKHRRADRAPPRLRWGTRSTGDELGERSLKGSWDPPKKNCLPRKRGRADSASKPPLLRPRRTAIASSTSTRAGPFQNSVSCPDGSAGGLKWDRFKVGVFRESSFIRAKT